jgi:hypothetical protein
VEADAWIEKSKIVLQRKTGSGEFDFRSVASLVSWTKGVVHRLEKKAKSENAQPLVRLPARAGKLVLEELFDLEVSDPNSTDADQELVARDDAELLELAYEALPALIRRSIARGDPDRSEGVVPGRTRKAAFDARKRARAWYAARAVYDRDDALEFGADLRQARRTCRA